MSEMNVNCFVVFTGFFVSVTGAVVVGALVGSGSTAVALSASSSAASSSDFCNAA